MTYEHILMPYPGKYLAKIVWHRLGCGHVKAATPRVWRELNTEQSGSDGGYVLRKTHLAELAFDIQEGEFRGYRVPGFFELDTMSNPNSKIRRLLRALNMGSFEPQSVPLRWLHHQSLSITTRNEKVSGGFLPVAVDFHRLPPGQQLDPGETDPNQETFSFVTDVIAAAADILAKSGPRVSVRHGASTVERDWATRHGDGKWGVHA